MANQAQLGDAVWNITGDRTSLQAAIKGSVGDLQGMGNVALGVGGTITAALGGVGIAAIGVANEFDVASGKMQAALGLPEEQARQFEKTIEEVYGDNFGDTIADAGQAVTDTFQQLQRVSGDATVNLKEHTEAALALRDAYGVEVSESVSAAATLMEHFGLTTDQAFDFITGGMQRGLNASGDFLDSIGEYSTQFASGGADAGQFFSLLETGLQGGVLGTDKAADAFKEFRVRILDGSSATSDALAQIGIDAETFTGQMADGSITIADGFQTVLERLGDVEDQSVLMQAGVGLIGTQFEDMGQAAVLALDLTKTKLEDVDGSTEKLNAQYNNLGTAIEGLKRKAILALKPMGDALLETINEHMPQIESAFEELIALGPEFADIFTGALDLVLDTLIPATVATVEFLAENKDLIVTMTDLAIKMTPVLLAFGGFVKIGLPVINLLRRIAGGATAATGVAGVAGVGTGIAGMESALAAATVTMGSFALGAAAVFGAAGIVAFGVVSVGLFVKALEDLSIAKENQIASDEKLRLTTLRRIEQLEAEGVAVDRNALAHMDADERIAALNAASLERRDEDLQRILLQNATEVEAQAAMVQAKNLALNENLTAEEAASVALLDIDAARKTALLTADAEHTQRLLEEMGVRAAAIEEIEADIVDTKIAGAITAAEFQQALIEDFERAEEEGYQGRSLLAEDFYERLKQADIALRSDMSESARAERAEQKRNAEERLAELQSINDEQIAGQETFSAILEKLTKNDIENIQELSDEQREAVGAYVESLVYLGEESGDIAQQTRDKLHKLSLDHRESPSINDLVEASVDNYTAILGGLETSTTNIMNALFNQWTTTWQNIGDFVFNILQEIAYAAANVLAGGFGFANGGLFGFAGGGVIGTNQGVPRFASGGSSGGGLAIINERGPEPIALPEGSRVMSHEEMRQIVGRSAMSGHTFNAPLVGNVILQNSADEDRLVRKLRGVLRDETGEQLRLMSAGAGISGGI